MAHDLLRGVSELGGRVAIVTGAGAGIGREIARALAAAGASVAALDLDADAARATAAEVDGLAVGADVSAPDEVRRAFDDVLSGLGRVDVLVNNAGIRRIGALTDYALEDWQRTIDVNLTGTFLCSQTAIAHMLPAGGGRIINIASIAGVLALANRVAYNVSKAGIIMLTKTVAFELGSRGIRCNAVAPGVVETRLTQAYFGDEAFASAIRDATPDRRWGQPDDIAGPVVFLSGDRAGFMNGETLCVDGGWCAGKGY